MTTTASTVSQRESRSWIRPLAWVTLAGIVSYVAIDVLLAFLRPGYSLLYNAESDYGRGPWFWVMDLNFLLRCALSLALCLAITRAVRLSGTGRAGVILLEIWAICSGLLAFFADDLEGQPQHGSGLVHLGLAFVAFLCVMVGTVLVSFALRADQRWRSAGTALLILSLAGVLGFLLLGHAVGHPARPGGLYERIFLGLELGWLAVAAGYLARTDRLAGGVSGRVAPPSVVPGR
jgi:hypothetical membrane protein